MKSALNAPHLCNEEAAIEYVEARLGRTVRCAHIAARSAKQPHEGQDDAARSLELPRLPEAVHGADADRFRVQPHSAAYLASDDLPILLVQEGHQHAPVTAHFRR